MLKASWVQAPSLEGWLLCGRGDDDDAAAVDGDGNGSDCNKRLR